MSKLLLKRDETSQAAPAPEQLEIGELVLNSVTGRLYTKLKSGDVVEYIGQKVCFTALPVVKFYYENVDVGDLIDNFCCAGGMLIVTVEKLRIEPAAYTFSLVELTNNTTAENISLSSPEYEVYTESGSTYRKASIPVTLSVNPTSYKNISIFKLNVFLEGIKISEHLITLKCLEGLL